MLDVTPPAAQRSRWWSVRAELARLRLAAVALPVLYLVAAEVVRHALWPTFWHSTTGGIVLYATTGLAVVVFAIAIFSLIERYEDQRERQAKRIDSLHRLASTASERLDVEAVIQSGLDDVLESIGGDAGIVCRIYPEEWEHSALCTRGLSPEVQREIQRAKLADDPIADRVASTGEPVVFREVFDDPRVRAAAAREGIQDGMTVPLVAAGAVNGVVAIAYRRPHEFTGDERAFLISAGRQLGLVLRNVGLYEQTVRQNNELSGLLAVSWAISRSQDVSELARSTLPAVLEVMECNSAEFWRLGREGFTLIHRVGLAVDAPNGRSQSQTTDELLERSVSSDDPQIEDVPRDSDARPGSLIDACIRRRAATSIRYGGAVLGVLTVGALNPERLRSPTEIRLLTGIAELIGPVLENARLRAQLQHEAVLEERERISREMHDGLAQILGYVNTQALAVQKLLADGQYERASLEVERLQAAARDVYADVREGILALHESAAQGSGAMQALEEYVAHFRELFDIDVALSFSESARSVVLTSAAELQVVRIVQEALSNVRRHANATHVEIRGWIDGNCLGIEVLDDGDGFDTNHQTSSGRPRFGLRTMEERARAVGGTFDVSSAESRGTTVSVRIPVDNA